MNKQITEKSLVDKLQDLEDKMFFTTIEVGFEKYTQCQKDGETIREARYLITRMCKQTSEDTIQQIRDLIDLMAVEERVNIIEGLAKYFLTNSELAELGERF